MDAKNRLVLKGRTDPESQELQMATPTPETVDINMVLCVIASMRWKATVGDIKCGINSLALTMWQFKAAILDTNG
eukprot:1023692-Amphidinium_carterae.1